MHNMSTINYVNRFYSISPWGTESSEKLKALKIGFRGCNRQMASETLVQVAAVRVTLRSSKMEIEAHD